VGFVDLVMYHGAHRSGDTVQQLHEHTQANMPSVGQMMQNGDNYLRDGHLMPPERLRIDVLRSLVVLRLVTSIVATALTLMHVAICAYGRQSSSRFLEAKDY